MKLIHAKQGYESPRAHVFRFASLQPRTGLMEASSGHRSVCYYQGIPNIDPKPLIVVSILSSMIPT